MDNEHTSLSYTPAMGYIPLLSIASLVELEDPERATFVIPSQGSGLVVLGDILYQHADILPLSFVSIHCTMCCTTQLYCYTKRYALNMHN